MADALPEQAAAGPVARRPIGRPTTYTDDIARELLTRLAAGETLTAICADDHMPTRNAVHRWTVMPPADVPKSFRDEYARARELQAETYFDQVLEISDGAHQEAALIAEAVAAGEDVTARAAAYRQTYLAEMAARRLRFDARRWVTARIAPWRYGDQIKHQHQISGQASIQVVSGVDSAPGTLIETTAGDAGAADDF